jgi:hypothetical protein
MEARINALADENQKLRDDLLTVRSDLAVTKNDLSSALTRVGTMEHSLHELETLDPRFEEMKEGYERLSTLLRGEHLFDSEKFRTAIHAEVKSSIGYYWPSIKSDLRAQLWKEFPEPVKDHVEKEIAKVVDEVVMLRSKLVALQQNPATGGSVQNGDPAVAELKQAMERIEKQQQELGEAMSEVGQVRELEIGQVQELEVGQTRELGVGQTQEFEVGQVQEFEVGQVQEFERAQGAYTSNVPRLTPNNTGNST